VKPIVPQAMIAGFLLSNQTMRAQQQASVEWLSVPASNIGDERVIALDLKASDGAIRSFPNIPRGWFISITNDASGTTEVTGNAQVGAAAVGADYFKGLAGLERQSPEMPVSHVTLEIVVTKDFATERHIDILASGLLLSKNSQ
jgi:hypothetical protein